MLGSFTPATGFEAPDGVTDCLCRLNTYFYIAILGIVVWLVNIRFYGDSEALYQAAFAVLGMMILWMAFRLQGSLAQELRLAKNAKRVMRVMGGARYGDGHAMLMLKDLPWLPAFDRRDVLVVQELVARLAPESKLSTPAVQALALSVYAAAAFAPAA
eukprot:2639014-Prymnesium_polylepis.1